MKVFREVITMFMIGCAVLLILILLFSNYLTSSTTVPDKSSYKRNKAVSSALSAKSDLENEQNELVIGTLSKAAYNIDEEDINEYIAEGMLTQGKVNPFAEVKDDSSSGSSSGSTSGSANTGANSGSSSNVSSNVSSNASAGSSSNGATGNGSNGNSSTGNNASSNTSNSTGTSNNSNSSNASSNSSSSGSSGSASQDSGSSSSSTGTFFEKAGSK